jgi:hypothetical protein
MKVLMVLTSHDQLGNTGRKTGFWLRPINPADHPNLPTGLIKIGFSNLKQKLLGSVRLDSVKQEDYDTVFYPGGHGPMWDLVDDKNSIKLLESFLAAGKTFAGL